MALSAGRHDINIGVSPNDSTGDTIRAGGEKINHMFSEIYSAIGDGSSISFTSSTTLAQIIAISSDLGSYVANTNTLLNKMDDVYNSIGDGTVLTFNVATYLNETQTLTNKTIAAIDNNLVVNLEELTNVNSSPVVSESILTYDPGSSEWVGKAPAVYGPVLETLTPNVASTYDVGSSTYPFRHLFLSNTISLGTETIQLDANGDISFSAPIAASSITSHSVVTQVLTQNANAVFCSVVGDDVLYDTTFDNAYGSWIPFPFDEIESESPAGGWDTSYYEYTVQVPGTYKVSLHMMAPSTHANAEFMLVTTMAKDGGTVYHKRGWIAINDSEQSKDYYLPDAVVGDKFWVDYWGMFYQRSQISITRI